MQCPKCGNQNPDDAQICQSCSSVLSKASVTAQRQTTRTSALAILSFALSLMSLVAFPLMLIAIVFGVVSIVIIKKSNGKVKGVSFAAIGIIVFILVFFIYIPVFLKIRQTAHRMLCGTNMSILGMAMLTYTNDYNDNFPTSSKWCDFLITYPDVKPSTLCCKGASEGPCNYAINKNIEKYGLKSSPDMVVLFETHPGSNQSGGPEILTTYEELKVKL